MRILIVKLSAFGDIIHALPALDDLRRRPEQPEIHWLVDARYAFVTEVLPPDVQVHVAPLKAGDWRGVLRAIRELRALGFDAVLDLQGLIKSAVLARLAGAPVFGLDARQMREQPARWLERCTPFHPDERHIVQQLRRVAAAPFASDSEPPVEKASAPDAPIPYRPPRIPLTDAMQTAADETLRGWALDEPYVWLHLGGGWATKQLPEATWRAVAEGATERGLTPVLGWGNTHEHKRARQLGQLVPAAFVPPRRLPMPSLCGVLARARAVIGADTGVVHLAAALGTPTISFWGPSASWRSGPQGPADRHVESNPPCGPCFRRTCDQFVCMDMIRAGDILAALDEIRS